MLSGEWHRFNGHFKSLITERMVAIERKGLETIRINDYAGYMVTSNQDAPLKIDIGDSRIVCFDVSAHCRNNTSYFDRLEEILDHPDALGVVMSYLLSRDLSNWSPRKIPATKMKVDIMREQLPNPIRFLIDHIASWDEDSVLILRKKVLYQKYLEWCGDNGEKPLSNNIFGKKLSEKNIIECKQGRVDNGKRKWQYILNCSKIVAKLRESGLGNIEEFSDIPESDISQSDIPENKTTDIPIFNVPEIIPLKIIPSQPEKNVSSCINISNSDVSNQDESTQVLFNYVGEDTCAPVASTSGTTETTKASEPPESVIDESKTSKPPEPIKSSNKVLSAILPLDNKKDRLDSIAFRYKMEMDGRMCDFAKESKEDPSENMEMTVWERLIEEKIICRDLEE
ncbi:hypothetical protein C2G38_2160558 [Gigaspora rosea]|uniref:Uncharacterized protein n=1 Tax=Gigaspora rosea TaxID=44941 RepID=A0A397W087_9GLOM|nr:hypothetical protein C2G38_2160558 [Gigaspora rosea]